MFCFDLMERTRKNGGKKHGWEDVPCSRETTQVCNTTWPAEAFSYNQHAKSITFIPEDLRVTGLDSCVGQNRFREQQRAWVLLWELVHISMNSCSIRGYVNLHNKPPWEEWIYFCCYTYWIHAFLIYAEIWPAVYKRQPFCESSLDRGGTESTKLQPHTSSVLCPFFQFSELKCFPHSPTPCIPSSISLHLVGPTCLSLICLPCTIPHFSLSLWIIYLHTTPPPPIYRFHSFLFLSLSFPSILLSITHSSLALSFFSFITFWRLSHQLSHSSHLTNQILSPTLLSPHYNIVEKGEKINRFEQTNQSSGNSLFVREIKITDWWMNMLTLYFPLNEPLSLRLWHGSTYWSSMFAASA